MAPPTSFLAALSPDAAVLLFSIGCLLVFLELNRPGNFLPGALGLLLGLLAAGSLGHVALSPLALLLLAAGTAVPLWQLRHKMPPVLLSVPLAAVPAGFRLLVRPGGGGSRVPAVHLATALLCGVPLAAITCALAHLAYLARRNKEVN